MTLPVFPHLKSIGNGANTKKESKANAIIAFLAHMEKRKQVGLFVPYVVNRNDRCQTIRHVAYQYRFLLFSEIYKWNCAELRSPHQVPSLANG